MQRNQLNQEIREGTSLHHVNAPDTSANLSNLQGNSLRNDSGLARSSLQQGQSNLAGGAGVGTATMTRTDVDINMGSTGSIRQGNLNSESVLRENVTTTREYIKDELVVQQTSETLRQAPIVHEKHIYHEQPMLQERHIYKEVPVVERTVVHEQPSLTTRDVIHELPVQINQSQIVKEAMPVQHEVQKVQHELRVVEDAKLNQKHIHSQQEGLGSSQLGAEKITATKQTTTTTTTGTVGQSSLQRDSKLSSGSTVTGSAAPKI